MTHATKIEIIASLVDQAIDQVRTGKTVEAETTLATVAFQLRIIARLIQKS